MLLFIDAVEKLGSHVFVGPHVTFTNDLYPRAATDDFKLVETKVEDHASIGAGSVVICGITIGEFAMIGAGSVVTKSVPRHALVLGNPAGIVGYVCECGHRLDEHRTCESCGKRIDIEG